MTISKLHRSQILLVIESIEPESRKSTVAEGFLYNVAHFLKLSESAFSITESI